MAVWSIVNRSDMSEELRWDAEYYHPDYLKAEANLNHCKTAPLGRLGHIVASAFYPAAVDLYASGDVPFARCVDVVDFPYIRTPEEFKRLPTEFLERNSSIQIAHSGDLIITKVGTPCFASVIGEELPKVALSRTVLGVTDIDRKQVDPFYLMVFLRCKYGFEQLQRERELTIQMQLTLSRVRGVRIFLPSEVFQQEITRLAKEFVEQTERSAQSYESAQTQLLTALNLHDWQPPRVLTWTRDMSQVASEARCDAEHFSPSCEALRDIIRNYSGGFEKLTDLAHISTDTTHPALTPDECFNYVELSSIDSSLGVIESPSEVTGRSAPSRARMVLRSGDVLVASVEGSIEKTAIVGEDLDGALASTGFFVLRTQRATPEYLLALCQSFFVREQLRCEASGTILTAIAANRLPRVLIPRLAPDEEAAIGALVSQSHAARKSAQELLQRAKSAVEIAIESGEAAALEWLNAS